MILPKSLERIKCCETTGWLFGKETFFKNIVGSGHICIISFPKTIQQKGDGQKVSSGPMGDPEELCKGEILGFHSLLAPNPLAPPPASLPNFLPSFSSTLQMPLLPLCDIMVKCKAVVLDHLRSNAGSSK